MIVKKKNRPGAGTANTDIPMEGFSGPVPIRPYAKEFHAMIKQADEDTRTIQGWASTSGIDKVGDIVHPEGLLNVDEYMKNPVLTYMHNWREPVGHVMALEIRDDGVWVTAYIDSTEEKLWRKIKEGTLRAFSIGYDVMQEDFTEGINHLKQWELLEIAIVSIPANTECLFDLAKSLATGTDLVIRQAARKGAIPFKHFPLDDLDAAWDGPAERKAAEVDDLKLMAAWFDSDAPDAKASYKLHHHRAASPHKTVWAGVKAAGTALMGGRGGVDIPAGDVAAVKAHLAKHYAEFEKEPPWEKAAADEDYFGYPDQAALAEWITAELAYYKELSARTLYLLKGMGCSSVEDIPRIVRDLRGFTMKHLNH